MEVRHPIEVGGLNGQMDMFICFCFVSDLAAYDWQRVGGGFVAVDDQGARR